MSDNLDIAADRAELFREQALRNKKPTGPAATGFCLWCEEPLGNDTARWCCPECRDQYEFATRRGR